MLLTRLEPSEAIAVWPSIERVLEPALERGEAGDRELLRKRIADNDSAVFVAHGFAGFSVVIARLADTPEGRLALFLYYLAGNAGRLWQTLPEAVELFFEAARQAGCSELRLGGRRGFRRVFNDFDVLSDDGSHVELRKVIHARQ